MGNGAGPQLAAADCAHPLPTPPDQMPWHHSRKMRRKPQLLALTMACACESSAAASGNRLPEPQASTKCLAVPFRRPS